MEQHIPDRFNLLLLNIKFTLAFFHPTRKCCHPAIPRDASSHCPSGVSCTRRCCNSGTRTCSQSQMASDRAKSKNTGFGTGVSSDLPSATQGTSRFFTDTLRRWLVSPNRNFFNTFLVKNAKIACFGVFAAYLIITVAHLLRPTSFLSALIDLIEN